MKLYRVTRLVLGAAALSVPCTLSAQAFGLNEIGSCAVARGYAVTASPCRDASAIYWNPAATTSINGWSISAGAAVISIKGAFAQDTTGRKWDADVPTKIIPHAFLNYHSPTSKAAFGIGFYVPYGLTSQWTEDFPGRFSAQKAALATFYVQPNFAWQITPEWSIGGGPVIGHSTVELVQGLDLSGVPTGTGVNFSALGIATGTEFGKVKLNGSAIAYGGQIAIAGKPSPEWSLGVRFLTPLEFKYDDADAVFTPVATNLVIGGDLSATIPRGTPVDALVAGQFTGNGALVNQKVSTKITHPAQVQGGIAYSGFKNWLLEGDYAWVGWKRFDVLPVTFAGPAKLSASRLLLENYNNSSSVRLGAEYTIPTDGWKLRAGFAGVASAAPPETVTPLLPEQDRTYWTVGAGIPVSVFTLDASYAHIFTPGARGRIAERTSLTQTADQLNTGVYSLSANVFSLTLKATF